MIDNYKDITRRLEVAQNRQREIIATSISEARPLLPCECAEYMNLSGEINNLHRKLDAEIRPLFMPCHVLNIDAGGKTEILEPGTIKTIPETKTKKEKVRLKTQKRFDWLTHVISIVRNVLLVMAFIAMLATALKSCSVPVIIYTPSATGITEHRGGAYNVDAFY